ncbi:hypothetical protein AVEN_8646-1 [Araneus ventricosus]|uniref:C2H2-type domain-containing protein n=1 Tax=Araneus ventricosus TaxID=182803 RepID=A0A4Y2C3P3_ARAVE|nr:hypothetical protein AVEN_8646-1 [Araneus ventricosus]
MAVHEKTSKWFNDCVKRERHRRNKCSLKQGQTGEKEQNQNLPAHYSHCCYCIKVFYDAKFLVKHMLRRHSDKLIELHKNMLSVTKSEKVIHETPDLFEFLKAEFSDLKVEVDFIKKALADHMQDKNEFIAERKSDNKSSNNKKCANLDSTAVSTKSDSLKYKHAETSAKVVSNEISADDFQNLQVRIDKLFQMFSETMVSKEDIEKTLALNEERICRTLKNELLMEIQNILSNHQKKNRDEYEAHYLELQREVDKLEKAVQLNSKKIESPDCLRKIQSKFESRIQNLLTGHSLFTSNAKRNKMNKNRNSNNEQKLTLHKPKRQTKSIYTSNSVYNKSNDLSGISKNKGFHSSLSHRRNQKHFEGTSYINGESIFSPSKCNQLKTGEQEKLHEFNSLINNSDNFTEKHLKEVKLIVNEKLKSLNLDPGTEKLSNEEFEKKMRLVNSEKELLEKKYGNFSQIRDELDSHLNKVVKSKLRKKLPKRLRFSDSPSILSSDSIDSDSAVKISCTAQKQESSGFILSDVNAQGDSLSYKNFDVGNLPSIQENGEDASEGSYTDYPHQSSTQQQNDDKSFKIYVPASPVDYLVENTAAKKSTVSLLQKSVEEMSDLSSLESDILEDECDNLKGAV